MNETRYRRIELRAADDLGEGVVRGYVTTFDDPYDIGFGVQEVIKRDAFSTDTPVVLFWEHNWNAGPIGVSRSLRKDGKGLEAEFELFIQDDQRARAVWRAMKAGALKEFSIGFLPDTIERSEGGKLETITKGQLLEVSSVVKGANPNTETASTRAVPAVAPAAPGAVPPPPPHPGAVPPVPGAELEEEKPTPQGLVSEVAEVVQMAMELHMEDQLLDLVKQSIKLFQTVAPKAPPAPHDPNAVPAAPPAPPARAAADVDVPESLFAALSRMGYAS